MIGEASCVVDCDCITPANCYTKTCTVTTGSKQPQVFPPLADPCAQVPKFLALRVTCATMQQPEVRVPAADVFVQAFEVGNGGGDNPVRKLLVVNKQEHPLVLHLGADLGVSESTATRYIAGDAPWSPIRNSTWGLLSSAPAGGLPGWFVGALSL